MATGSHIADLTNADQLADAMRSVPRARMADYGLAGLDAERLHSLDAGDGLDWAQMAEALGERHLEETRVHGAAGHHALCRLEGERAAAAFNIAQLVMPRDNPEKRRLYARASASLEANANLPACDYRRLTVSAGDGRKLYGWDFPVSDPIGCAVMFGGLSGWGASFMGLARAFARQGVRTILAEAPGQGETRLVSRLYLSRAALTEAMAFVERAASWGAPVGLVGFSFGGLIAAHLAASAPHVAALCTNGSPSAIGAIEHPAEREQFAAAFGAEGTQLIDLVRDFAFDPASQVLNCPVLALEGGADPLVAPGTWRGFVGAREAGATAVLWRDGLHTLYNHASERNALIAAWLADRFHQQAGN